MKDTHKTGNLYQTIPRTDPEETGEQMCKSSHKNIHISVVSYQLSVLFLNLL